MVLRTEKKAASACWCRASLRPAHCPERIIHPQKPCLTLQGLLQGMGMRAQRKASKQERLLVQSIAAAAATMEAAPARPTSQEPGKAPGKPATQKPTVSLLEALPCTRSRPTLWVTAESCSS